MAALGVSPTLEHMCAAAGPRLPGRWLQTALEPWNVGWRHYAPAPPSIIAEAT